MATTTTHHQTWSATPLHTGDSETVFLGAADADGDELLAEENKWPAWRVTVGVLVFCTAAWMGIGYLATRLLG